MDSLILITNLMLMFVLLICGAILFFVKPIPHSSNKSYRIAKHYMAFLWLIMGISIVLALTVGKFGSEDKIEILNIYSVSIFSVGSFCALFSFLYLYNASKIIRQEVCWLFSPVLFLILLHCVIVLSWGSQRVYSLEEYGTVIGHSPALVIRTLILCLTVIDVVISIKKYFKARKEYEKTVNNYFSDNEEKRFRWIDKMFYSMILILLFVTPSYLINVVYYDFIYSIVYSIISICYTVKIINYQCLFHTISPAIEFAESIENEQTEQFGQTEQTIQSGNVVEEQDNLLPPTRYEENLRMVNASVEKWINNGEKSYLKNRLTIQDVSLMTGISKRRLADFIHMQYNLSFNSWINTLRVQEVERILSDKENEKMTLSEISYKTGFSDLSNMSNTFKKIRGINPSEYKKSVNQ